MAAFRVNRAHHGRGMLPKAVGNVVAAAMTAVAAAIAVVLVVYSGGTEKSLSTITGNFR